MSRQIRCTSLDPSASQPPPHPGDVARSSRNACHRAPGARRLEGRADVSDLHALAAIDLLDHANAIRLPTISSAVPVSTDEEVEKNLNRISGVDERIRTTNNRNHNPRSL